MRKLKDCGDLVGKRFSHVLVLRETEPIVKGNGRNAAVICRCDCGKEFRTQATKVRLGRMKSCGCGISHRDVEMPGHRYDITGERIGSWTVGKAVKIYDREKHSGYYYRCRCDCGTERLVSGQALMDGKSLSCGCRTWSGTPRKSFVREGRDETRRSPS